MLDTVRAFMVVWVPKLVLLMAIECAVTSVGFALCRNWKMAAYWGAAFVINFVMGVLK